MSGPGTTPPVPSPRTEFGIQRPETEAMLEMIAAHPGPGAPDPGIPAGFVWNEDTEQYDYALLTAKETAERLGVSERSIRRWITSGRLYAEKSGGEFRIRIEDARVAMAGTRAGHRTSSVDARMQWLEAENERLWSLLEKALSR